MDDWSNYLKLSLICFACFFLEFLSIGIIYGMSGGNFQTTEKCIHLIVMSAVWAILVLLITKYSRRKFHFPSNENEGEITKKDWIICLLCLVLCKVITFIDWHTLKVIGEYKNKSLFYYTAQYIYYFFEVALVTLIIIYGQKAFEMLTKKTHGIPYGGIVLAITWGAWHFISRGTLDIWNGLSCIIFSVLSGIMYLKLHKNFKLSYIFIALGYLL